MHKLYLEIIAPTADNVGCISYQCNELVSQIKLVVHDTILQLPMELAAYITLSVGEDFSITIHALRDISELTLVAPADIVNCADILITRDGVDDISPVKLIFQTDGKLINFGVIKSDRDLTIEAKHSLHNHGEVRVDGQLSFHGIWC